MDHKEPSGPASRNKRLAWLIAGVLILLLVFLALQGIVRGGGEAVGVEESAPGDDNALPESTKTR